jgi:hypothetical protein
MKTLIRVTVFALLAVGAPASAQQAAGALPDTGRVQVAWQDPAQFSEVRLSPDKQRALEGDWVRQLALYVERAADKRLPAGEHLAVILEDVDRAGDRRGSSGVQVARAITPPTIRLRFVRTDTYGRTLAQGERTLDDPDVMGGTARSRGNDPLVFEKRLIDGWLETEVGKKP